DLLERLGETGQAAGFVEHELTDELLEPADALERLRLAEQLLGRVRRADADGRVELREVLRLHPRREAPVVLEDPGVETSCGPAVADVLDVAIAVGEHEPARGVRA